MKNFFLLMLAFAGGILLASCAAGPDVQYDHDGDGAAGRAGAYASTSDFSTTHYARAPRRGYYPDTMNVKVH